MRNCCLFGVLGLLLSATACELPVPTSGPPGASGEQQGADGGLLESTTGEAESITAAALAGKPAATNHCSPNPCKNGGTCTNHSTGYACTCKAGYSGNNCQTNINDCSPNPCKNGGTCSDGVNSHTCTCKAGYSGSNCENPINYCSPNPCQNGGTCTSGSSSYACSCPSGWGGKDCTTGTTKFTWIPLPFGYDTGSLTQEHANAISGDGSTIVGGIDGTMSGFGVNTAAWKWTVGSGSAPVLLNSGLECGAALGVSSNGSVIGGWLDPSGMCAGNQAAKWINGSETLMGSVGDGSMVESVSGDGSILVGQSGDSNQPPSKWNSSGVITDLISTYGAALGTSSNGSTIVGYAGSPNVPFKWTAGTGLQYLNILGTQSGQARGVSADGNIIVGNAGSYAARWTNTTNPPMTMGLGTAYATNQDGSVIVGVTLSSQAFVWTSASGTVQLLSTLVSSAPSSGLTATGVSSNGKIVTGYGTADSIGTVKGWVATLP